MRPPAAMNNLAYSLTNNFIPCFSGRLQGCIIGLNNNPIRSDHQNRILDAVEELLPCSGLTRFLGGAAVMAGCIFEKITCVLIFFHIHSACIQRQN